MSTQARENPFPLPAAAEVLPVAGERGFCRTSALLRPSEWAIATYFLISAARAALHGRPAVSGFDLMVPLVFLCAALVERGRPARWISIFRDWAAMPVLLLAYWNVDWAGTRMPPLGLEGLWQSWDHQLLAEWGGRQAIESCGPVLPGLLEACYLLLYAAPPLLLGVIYLCRRRSHAEWYLCTLFAGVLTTYALLPLFPLAPPRFAFPGQDLPGCVTLFRRMNLWLLGCGDIQTSVFPSGHVTVAFSAAFGISRALPARRWLGRGLVTFAALVAVNTVYARYHYAVDGLAALAISCAALSAARALEAVFPGVMD